MTVLIAMWQIVGGIPPVKAVTYDWLPTEVGTYNWDNSSYWAPGGVGFPNVPADVVNLDGLLLGNQFIHLNGKKTIGVLNIGDAVSGYSYIVQQGGGVGGPLAFDNNGAAAILNKVGNSSDVLAGVQFVGNTTVNVDAGTLTTTGGIGGYGTVTKTGDGMWVLRGVSANNFMGTLLINEGIVLQAPSANSGVALGNTGVDQRIIVTDGGTLAFGPVNNGSGGAGFANPITISGNGFRGQGAIRSYLGANTTTITGVITLADAARIHSDATNTLTISSALYVNQDLKVSGAYGLVTFTGMMTGSNTITKYGTGGLRFSVTNNLFSGSIVSTMGEVRVDSANSYNNVASFDIRNGLLYLVQPNNTNNTDNRLANTTPITLQSGRIRIENSAFTGNPAFTWTETIGAVTITRGHNMIDMRATAVTGSNTLTIADLLKPNKGTTFQLNVDSLPTSGQQIGVGTQARVLNQALETANVTVPFIGGWAYTNNEFVKYVPVGQGGNGYRALEAADYFTDQATSGWNSTHHIKITNNNYTLGAGTTTIRSLNMQNATARTLSGGTELVIGSGGILSSGGVHVISVPFLTAGAESNYELYDIAINTNQINSVIRDNGGNSVSLVKAGGGTTSFFGANTYTGTTYINEGGFRDVIGANRTSLGGGNLTFAGGFSNQAWYETDRDFTRALGTGAGQVQFIGGAGVGFAAYGAAIDINFGGAGGTVVWGTPTFDPGMFTLNGGNATHATRLVNSIDLNGEQRYFRLDGNSSGGGRAAIGIIEGDLFNGGVVKRGGGTLIMSGTKSYEGGTVIQEGLIWLREGGSLGANVSGNDIMVNTYGALHIDDASLVGGQQRIILQNYEANGSAAAIGFGPGYGDGSEIRFQNFGAGSEPMGAGGNNIFIANDQAAQGRRVAIQLNGTMDFSTDLAAQIAAIAPNVQVWVGATSGNAIYTGSVLSATNGALRLGTGGGTFTIQNANVLSGNYPLFIGATDTTARTNLGGFVFIRQAQNYSGQVTIGNAGILVVGQNGALSTSNNTINLRAGELRLSVGAGTWGGVDSQYASRNLDVQGANGIFRTLTLGGGGFSAIQIGRAHV